MALFWVLAAIVTLMVLAALFFAIKTGRDDAELAGSAAADRAHYRALLNGIETDRENGRLSAEEAADAHAEIARAAMRLEAEEKKKRQGRLTPAWAVPVVLAAVGVASFAIYAGIGSPALPGQPLAGRTAPAERVDVEQAIARVEAQVRDNPSDARGWAALGPVYMRQGRFDDAVTAFRKVLELLPPTADAETDLAEAIMMAQDGAAGGESMQLLQSAAARDPEHVRSRFYLAGEATRAGEFESAAAQWRALLALAAGEEPWVETARRGLAVAEAGMNGDPSPADPVPESDGQDEMIRGMVEGLEQRLMSQGGSIAEWTRLVRSWLVLGRMDKAQAAYDAARAAYEEPDARGELDDLARGAGLR